MSILSPPVTPVPVIYVSHLPSASSYYASLTQPIGIQFLSHANISPECLNFGYVSHTSSGPRKTVVFSITQSATPSLSHLTLSAPSEKAVREFHGKSWILNQDSQGDNILEKGADEEAKAVTSDFDGNMIEAIYNPRSKPGHRGSPVLELQTASTEKEARRVLEWQEKVARSVADTEQAAQRSEAGVRRAPAPGLKRADTFPLPFRESERLIRRETIRTTIHCRERERESDPPPVMAGKKESSKTDNAVIGGLIGVAAIAGFAAYAFKRSSSPEPMRRSSAGERGGAIPRSHAGPIEIIDRERVVERPALPTRPYTSERGHDDRDRAQSSYNNNYTTSSAHTQTRPIPMPISQRELARIDERSYHSSHSPTNVDAGTQYEREHSPHSPRRPRTIVPEHSPERILVPVPEIQERSPSPSRESHASRRSHKSSSRRHRHHDDDIAEEREDRDREKRYYEDERQSSYTSARSHHTHHTASTVKPKPDKPAVPNAPPAASLISEGSGGRHRRRKSSHPSQSLDEREKERYSSSPTKPHYSSSPTKPHYSSSPSQHSGGSRAPRHVPLPESIAGHSEWERGSVRMMAGLGREYNEYRADKLEREEEVDGYGSGGRKGGYAASVAPSDSISSVGVKRERDRLRDRMRMRDEHGAKRGVVDGGW